MKRAALVIHGPLSVKGGVERFNRYLLQFLIEEGFQVDLFEPSKLDVPSWIRRFLYPLVQYYYAGRQIQKELSNYDLVMTTGYTGGFLRGPRVMNITFGSVKSYFKSLENTNASWKIRLGNQLTIFFDQLSKKGKPCVAISPQVQEELKSDYHVKSIMIPCGLDTHHFIRSSPAGMDLRRKLGISPTAFVGLYAGRWAEFHKGLDVLVPLMRDRKDVTWLITPDCPIDLREIPNVKILEKVSYEEFPSVYSASDFGIQLSRYESFGFFFMECLACELPVISTPVGITPEVYNDPLLKDMLVHYGSSEETEPLVHQVHEIVDRLKDKSYRQRLGAQGRKKAEEDFSLGIWKSRMRNYLNNHLMETACK